MKSNIVLASPTLKVTAITKKTRAKLFEDIRVGDCIRFTSVLKYAGRASRGDYASHVTVENVTQGTSTEIYVSDASARLACFELEEAAN